jgi:hypothetical protein
VATRGVSRQSRLQSWLMRREAFVLSELSWWRAMPIGLSCLLHAGLVIGLLLGQQWVTSVVALQPPVLPKTVVQPVRLPKAR